MKTLQNGIDIKSAAYLRNCNHQLQLLDRHVDLLRQLRQAISPLRLKRHCDSGRLSAPQRLKALLDPNQEFLELSPMACLGMYKNQVPGAGLITGVGQVSGQLCMIFINNPLVKGGSYHPETVKKYLRAQEIAEVNNLPCLYLVDSGGAFLPLQHELFADREHFGRIFRNQARMSAAGIGQIAAVLGSCTAGGAYVPAMADESIMVEGQGSIYLAGPPLVKQAVGEIVSAEELGGTAMHASHSGLIDHVVPSDTEAMKKMRAIVARLALKRQDKKFTEEAGSRPPLYPAEEIYGHLPPDSTAQPFDFYAILSHLIDASEFDEFKQRYGRTLICGFARIGGHLLGVIANNGILFSESAQKGVHFIELCCQRDIPLIFFQNVTGFMVGKQAEASGIARHGAKMVMAVACAQVPKITIVAGASYGAGNYAMCGRAFDPDFLFMWPNAKIAVMGGAQAAGVLCSLKKNVSDDEKELLKQKILEDYTQHSSAYYATARIWDDGVILPENTRSTLISCLNCCRAYRHPKQSKFGIFRM